jgi:pimeloyl-ACP methyl ester carboxylesterase
VVRAPGHPAGGPPRLPQVLPERPARSELLAWAEALSSFDRPALVVWAVEDRVMPREHGPRLAALLPRGRLVEIADSYTLVPEDQPAELSARLRELTAATAWPPP